MKPLLIGLLRIYRRYISSLHYPACRFYPSCSQYCQEAVEKYGVVRGLFYAAKRILRCHPFSAGGYDPLK